MAIPFYEPRQQPATGCDQIDGHFPPAPSSQSVLLPTANLSAPMATQQAPTNPSTAAPLLAASATATPTALSNAFTSSSSSSATPTNTTSVTSSTSSSTISGTSAATPTFSISTTNPAATASLLSNSHSNDSTENSLPSSAATTSETLPWKLLAVAMCKALKQYYQQTGSADVFTTTVIEILPSTIAVGAQEQSPAAGN